jgi:predicted chitinase
MFLNKSLTTVKSDISTQSDTVMKSLVGALSTTETHQVFRFTLTRSSSVNLLAAGLTADVNVAIVRDGGTTPNQRVDAGEILGQSTATGTVSERVQLNNLAAGTYFVVVEAATGVTNANYSLTFGTGTPLHADILWRDKTTDQLGYWRFNGREYRDTQIIRNGVDDHWKVEAIGDFDGDRMEDILWRHQFSNELAVWLMDAPTGNVKANAFLTNSQGLNHQIPQDWRVVGVGDMNGDGKGDIVWQGGPWVAVWTMNGTSVAAQTGPGTAASATPGQNLIAIADMNADGKTDLVWQNSNGSLTSWVMNGVARQSVVNMSVTGMSSNPTMGAGYKVEAIADLNGDRKGDVLWRDLGGNTEVWLSQAGQAYRTGELQLHNNAVTNLATYWQMAGVDDFDGDGKADLAWRLNIPGHAAMGQISVWTMDGFKIGDQIFQTLSSELANLNRESLGSSVRPVDVNLVQLAGVSDSGVSQTDGITNVRQLQFNGLTGANAAVSLFANSQLVGTTTSAANGTWQIVTAVLGDGIYDVSAQVKNTNGAISNRSLEYKLMVDGTAAELDIQGPTDGIAWGSSVAFAGRFSDLDSGTNIAYTVKSNGVQVAQGNLASMIINNPNPTPNMLTQKEIVQQIINLESVPGNQTLKPYEVELKASDRAGNIRTVAYKGMRLNLPGLTEESVFLSDFYMPTLPDERQFFDPNDPNNPNNPNDGGGGRLFIGLGGAWGYGTTGTGTGGSSAWNWNNSGGSGNPPPFPRHIIDPEARIGYLPALRLMLTTARDVLSNHPATGGKKEALKRQLEMLMAVGKVVDENAFYEAMRPMLKGAFANAYASGGITKRQAVWNGWTLAKEIALDSTATTLQIFQANLYAVSLAALKKSSVTGFSATSLEATVNSLATNYAKLRPFAENYAYGQRVSTYNFIDNLWNNGYIAYSNGDVSDGNIVRYSISEAILDLTEHFTGQINPVNALEIFNRTLLAATSVRQLHEDAYVEQRSTGIGSDVVTYSHASSIQDAVFLKNLAEVAFGITRVNPTVTTKENPVSEWIELLLENKVDSAAGGLSDWFSAFVAEPLSTRRGQMLRGLNYAIGLVQMASDVIDPDLDQRVLRADFLSHLVNLGGTYSSLGLSTSVAGKYESFLDTVWSRRYYSGYAPTWELTRMLKQFASNERQNEALIYNNKLLRHISSLGKMNNQSSIELRAKLSDPSFVSEMLDWGEKFIASKDNANLFVDDLNGFLQAVRFVNLDGSIQVSSRDMEGVYLIANNRMSILDYLLDKTRSAGLRYADLGKVADVIASSRNSGEQRQSNINNLMHILTAAKREGVTDRGQLAFMLGVSNHESDYFQTLTEYDTGTQYDRAIEHMNDVLGDGSRYKGRGFVMLTGKLRYFYYTAVKQLSVSGEVIDLYNNPAQASNPKIAAAILVDYLKYGRASTKADWAYSSSGDRPRDRQPNNFTEAEMQNSLQPLSRYKFTGTQEASMSSERLNSQSASYNKFLDAASLVNGYVNGDDGKVASYSVSFFDVLKQFDPKSR